MKQLPSYCFALLLVSLCIKCVMSCKLWLNKNLIVLSNVLSNNILMQRIFRKNLNNVHKTLLPKKSIFNSALMFMRSSLSNDVSPAKKRVLILQTFLNRQISHPYCAIECFFSCVECKWSVNPLIHRTASLGGKFFLWDMFLESLFS